MKLKRRNGYFVPRLENLEDRSVPAGNVTAYILGGSLDIIGDGAGNNFNVVGVGAGTVTVSATDGGATTINGLAGVRLFGLNDSVYIKLGAGTNNVAVSGVYTPHYFWLAAGGGNNTIALSNDFAGRTMNVQTTAQGDDSISLNSIRALGSLDVNAGGGTDSVSIMNSFYGAYSSISDEGTGSTLNVVNVNAGPHTTMTGFNVSATAPVVTTPISTQTTSPPVAGATSATVAAGGTVSINVLANDQATGATVVPTSVKITTSPLHGSVTVNSAGAISYSNNKDGFLSDTFQYTVTDSLGRVSSPGTVTVTVGSLAPIAANATAAVTESKTVTIDLTKSVTTSGTDTVNDASFAISKQPTTGTVTVSKGIATYTQNGSYATSDSFQYTVADTAGNVSSPGTVSLTVTPTDHPPVAAGDSETVQPGASISIDLGSKATDADGTSDLDLTSIKVATQPSHGTVTVNSDGTVVYKNDGDSSATDSFSYTISDKEKATSNVATVTITIPQAAPSVAVTTTADSTTDLASIPFTATFSQPVTNFTAAGLSVTNGTASGFTAVSTSTYTFSVAPTADGTVTVTVPAGAAQNASGVENTAGTATVNSQRTDSGMDTVNVPDTTTLPFTAVGTDGVKIYDVQTGTGTAVTSSSSVTVFYTGFLASNGKIFDQQITTGSPAVFALSNLIVGFQEGTIGMKPGGIRDIFIPSAEGYGTTGSSPNIPANADLIFQVKLLATT